MRNDKLRNALFNYFKDEDPSDCPIILDNHEYDNSIIGITDTNQLVYDYNSMIEEFAKDCECTEEDAQEWVDYNTMRAIPYMGERKPIVIMMNIDEFVDIHGDDDGE